MGSIQPSTDDAVFAPELYPPFPADVRPCAKLETFSLARLRSDPHEQEKLLNICTTQGFFYLDFSDTETARTPQDAELVGKLAEQVFKSDDKAEIMYGNSQKPNSILGYKRVGYTKVDAKGTPDSAEFMNIGKDDILDNPLRYPVKPPALATQPQNRELLARFQKACHRAGLDIMSILAKKLNLTADAFEHMHRIDHPSDDHVRMTYGPARKTATEPEIQTPGHTDFGTITILWNWLGGLQVWSEPGRGDFDRVFDGEQNGESEWLWVPPKPGHAIVNLGDAAVKFTGGILCSGRHRVLPAPGEQGLWPRYSIVYFVRPEDNHVLKRFVGGDIPPLKEGKQEPELTSGQWIARQAEMLRTGKAGN